LTDQPAPTDPGTRPGAVGRFRGAQAGRPAGVAAGTLRLWVASVFVALVLVASTVVGALVPSTSMVWLGSQGSSAGVAVNATINVHSRATLAYSQYRVAAGHSHGPPTTVNAPFCREQTYYVVAGVNSGP
jgi:hypothetical protein